MCSPFFINWVLAFSSSKILDLGIIPQWSTIIRLEQSQKNVGQVGSHRPSSLRTRWYIFQLFIFFLFHFLWLWKGAYKSWTILVSSSCTSWGRFFSLFLPDSTIPEGNRYLSAEQLRLQVWDHTFWVEFLDYGVVITTMVTLILHLVNESLGERTSPCQQIIEVVKSITWKHNFDPAYSN